MKSGKALRIVTTVVLSLAAAMTILGGVGTSCVAFAAENFGPAMAALIPVKPIFQGLVVISALTGIFGVVAIVRLARRVPGAFWWVLGFLLVGAITSGIQFYFSATLRGKTAPNDMRLYLTLIALAWLLTMRIPSMWQRAGFDRTPSAAPGAAQAAGLAMVATGLLTISTPWWAAPTHVINGVNTANVLGWQLLATGAILLVVGVAIGWGAWLVARYRSSNLLWASAINQQSRNGHWLAAR